MADFEYVKGFNAILNGDLDLDTIDIRCVAADTGVYTADADADDFLDDIAAGARVVVSGALTVTRAETSTGPTISIAAFTFTSVPASKTIGALVFYYHTGTDATSNLIAYRDSWGGLPKTTDGSNITVTPPTDADKFFRIVCAS